MGCCGEARDGTVQSPSQPMMGQAQQSFNVTQPLGTQPMQAPTQQWGQSPITPPPPTQASPFNPQATGGAMNLQPMQSFGPSPQPGFSNQSPAPPSTVETGNQGPQGMNGMNTGYSPLLNGNPNIIRPSPVHAGTPPVRTSPPLATSPPSGFTSLPPMPMSMGAPIGSPPPRDDGKLSISVDFGTTASGVAYGSSRINNGKVQNIIHWPGSFENFRKVPTCILYNEHGQVLAWGLEAKNASPMPGTIKCEWFKLFLSPRSLRDPSNIDPRLPKLPMNKTASEVIVDYLSCLYEYARQQITREIGAVADLNSADVWLTVPAAWDAAGCDIMREAAIKAGLVQSAHAGDRNWRDRLRIITEPEAAAVHCVHLTDLHKLKPSQNFMVCDAGGGTVDLAIYRVIGSLTNLEIAEVCARSGANCGSIFLDMRFRELVRTLLSDHPVHLDPASQAFFMHAFAETEKLAYMGESDDDNYFHFTCFNVEDANDPNVGLVNGELAIPGNLLRREVFDPVIEQVLELLEDQVKKVSEPISALMLVGGFSGSEYLFKRVYDQFSSRIKVIARPDDADTATSRGAAQYGLARRPLVSSVISGKAYLMKVKLPAESDDWLKRPAYIKQNNAGATVCENRVQYLVHKGAILLKGQRIKTKFCKFSTNPSDRIFVAVLYTSESDKVMRYTDEGETQELCKWSVDLGMLPSFQYQASLPQPNGFYTEFELGLELDSAEVRGVLLHNGQEVSRVVFDFFQ